MPSATRFDRSDQFRSEGDDAARAEGEHEFARFESIRPGQSDFVDRSAEEGVWMSGLADPARERFPADVREWRLARSVDITDDDSIGIVECT